MAKWLWPMANGYGRWLTSALAMSRPAPAQRAPGPLARHRPVGDDAAAVDEDVLHADRIMLRILEGRDVVNGRRVEHRDVGGHAGTDHAAIGQPDPIGRFRG